MDIQEHVAGEGWVLFVIYSRHILDLHTDTNTHAAHRLPFLLSASKFILHRAVAITVFAIMYGHDVESICGFSFDVS